MAIKITAQQTNVEELIKDIAISGVELEGKGYVNDKIGIVGLMIYVKDDSAKTIDIFIELDDSKKKGLLVPNETKLI